ncbi:hypothetical protein F5884DRAFT_813545 [Xylogone sp. PMI_703]|nr:hypothetical protein F5884DRAFT_813545 [Xylogone sp. PMI_703]
MGLNDNHFEIGQLVIVGGAIANAVAGSQTSAIQITIPSTGPSSQTSISVSAHTITAHFTSTSTPSVTSSASNLKCLQLRLATIYYITYPILELWELAYSLFLKHRS